QPPAASAMSPTGPGRPFGSAPQLTSVGAARPISTRGVATNFQRFKLILENPPAPRGHPMSDRSAGLWGYGAKERAGPASCGWGRYTQNLARRRARWSPIPGGGAWKGSALVVFEPE